MRLHTFNRRKIKKATKGAKLRGIIIGGGRLTAPDAFETGPSIPHGRIPAQMSATSIPASLHRRAKRGDRVRWIDVLSLVHPDGTTIYARHHDGSIRKAHVAV